MKFKTLLVSALIGLTLTACNDDSDRSGTYFNSQNESIEIHKTEKHKYVIRGEKLFKSVAYEKNNELYDIADNALIGKFDGNVFKHSSGDYKKR
ncbi:TPA: hypothetical protein ACPKA2_001720 [Haemophilus influenzae]|jgi:hypothetical protein|nr:hypothetical protein [Haemophilus influenzae]RFN77093.1 hypothetical protein CH630_08975 [Haemophilus influenzae]